MILLSLSLALGIRRYVYPGEWCPAGVSETVNQVCEFLKVNPQFDVVVFECETLQEFHQLTSKPYFIGAVYKDGIVITQPFEVLRKKGVLQEIITHEVLHHVLQSNFKLPVWLEEGFILYETGASLDQLYGNHKYYLEKFLREVPCEKIYAIMDSYRICDPVECY